MADETSQPLNWLREWGPIVLFVLALGLVTTTAWWQAGQDLSSAYTGISATALGLIINPQNGQDPGQLRRWYFLIFLAAAVCTVSVISLVVHINDTTAAKNAAAAVIAAFGALAGIVLDLSKLPAVVSLLGRANLTTGTAIEVPAGTNATSYQVVMMPVPNGFTDSQHMADEHQ